VGVEVVASIHRFVKLLDCITGSMSSELECGSEEWGRYTCKYAPTPSVCCTNGCCAISPTGDKLHSLMPLWERIVIALSVGVAALLLFAFLKYRDRRGYRAYKRLRELQQQQQQQPGQDTVQGGAHAVLIPADAHEPAATHQT
jgi:hypothetical protein